MTRLSPEEKKEIYYQALEIVKKAAKGGNVAPSTVFTLTYSALKNIVMDEEIKLLDGE